MQNSQKRRTRRSVLLSLIGLALVTAVTVVPTQFQMEVSGEGEGLFTRTGSHEPGLENYDIREQKGQEFDDAFLKYRNEVGKDAAFVADIRDGFVRGEEELRTRVPSLKVEYNQDIRTPEVITPDVWKGKIERLTEGSTTKRSEILRNFVKENNSLIGVSDAEADSLKVLADYTNPNGYMSFAHLEQRINGIPVFRSEIKAGFTKSGEMIRVINNLAPGLDYESLSADFRNPLDAVRAAARHINNDTAKMDLTLNGPESDDLRSVFGQGDNATTAEKMYFPIEPGVAVPAWRILIWQPINAYYIIVDNEGRMLWRKNTTEDQTTSATYNVYNNSNAFMHGADSPAPLSPGPLDPTTGTQGVLGTRVNVTLIGNEGPLSFNNNGWITDGTNVTDGNAVEAGVDRVAPDGVDAPQPGDTACPGAGCRVFSSTWNPPPGNPAPGDDPLTPQAQRGAVIQMFYIMNRFHDTMYQLGWTEQAFNFQTDNFSRGGVGNDRLRAEGQDSSNVNNANMSTQADGTRPRMQMFLWTGPTPDYDGTPDAEILIHEVTHGLSNRLHGNASGLSTNMARGMGEGWSDWYAYTMLAEPTDPINGIYTTGGYATFQITGVTPAFTANYYYGIRRFPRAPITFLGANGKPHNPFTLRYINAGCATLIGTTTSNPPPNSAFPRGPVGSSTCDQVHNIGEIWSSMLWQVRNRMVERLGFTAGTTRALQVVTDGMKLAPIGPTILQERDAIIAAATALPLAPEAAADVLDVREGFRVRGAGFSAVITAAGTGSNNAVVTEAFDVPNAIITNPITVSDSTGDNDGFPEPTESVLVSVPVTNNSGATINNVQMSVTGGGSVNYGNIADGATVVQQIPYTVPAEAPCGSMHQITITGTSSLGALNPQNFSFRLGAPVGGAPLTFSNTTPIDMPAGQPTTTSGPASPYPSTINVAGVSGSKLIKVTFNNFRHEFLDDVDMLLVGPGGQKYIFLSDAGGSTEQLTPITFSLADNGETQLPDATPFINGTTYRPANYGANDPFDPPAPAAPYENAAPGGAATFASVFGTDGAAMNGAWSLYIDDDAGSDPGRIENGWAITFESNDYLCNVKPGGNGRGDFDGDGRTDLAVHRPSDGNWYGLRSSDDSFFAISWGLGTDTMIPADYDGDGKTDTAVFRPDANPSAADFWILNSNGFTITGLAWGLPGDIPAIGDFDNDGKADAGIYRASEGNWYILLSGGGFVIVNNPGTTPVPADYNGDGADDGIIFTNGTWAGTLSGGGGPISISHGQAGDIPVAGDYDGDGIADQAVYRPSTGQWIVRRSSDSQVTFANWGTSTDIPVPGDYDGDGKDDLAIYRPSTGEWWIDRSTSGVIVRQFGLSADRPVPRFANP